jgi:ArsR family transcriptional regulator
MANHLHPASVFKCLGDETRVRLMLIIAKEGDLCVCDLTHALAESQPKVSRHLAQLRACGLLEDRRQGQWVYYRLHPDLPRWVFDVLHTTLESNQHWLEQNMKRIAELADRPSACL